RSRVGASDATTTASARLSATMGGIASWATGAFPEAAGRPSGRVRSCLNVRVARKTADRRLLLRLRTVACGWFGPYDISLAVRNRPQGPFAKGHRPPLDSELHELGRDDCVPGGVGVRSAGPRAQMALF